MHHNLTAISGQYFILNYVPLSASGAFWAPPHIFMNIEYIMVCKVNVEDFTSTLSLKKLKTASCAGSPKLP